jgi:ABC-type multidrug transport system fused ATPase/permease subunit
MPTIRGEVTFDHVNFHYSDDPTPVLTDINLHILPGETVALVGETGAGKSTLVKLIARFHDPCEGNLLIDGRDLREVTQQSLRIQMGIVLQDPFLLAGYRLRLTKWRLPPGRWGHTSSLLPCETDMKPR